MNAEMNVAGAERWASAIGGAALAVYGLKHLKDERSVPGAMIAASGERADCAQRDRILSGLRGGRDQYGATARYRHAAVLGGSTRRPSSRGGHDQPRRRPSCTASGGNFEQPAALHGSPRVGDVQRDPPFSHWVAKAPAGRTVEWDARVINDIPDELIAWRTARQGRCRQRRFGPVQRGRPADAALKCGSTCSTTRRRQGRRDGRLAARPRPSQTIREDLRRFKQLMETGEVPTTKGSRAEAIDLNYDWRGRS